MNKALLFALMILLNISSFAQKTITDPFLENKLFKPYDSYFNKDREWIYTHLNKSAYIQGDDIWFTSYILNPASKQLNFITSKLYVELWSPEKKLINRKILFVKAGTTDNYIHLADSLEPGKYCFRTYTNWMRNFYQKNDFNTFITILGSAKSTNKSSVEKQKKSSNRPSEQKEKISEPAIPFDYDIQFLPESGRFLEGADNVLGIKATDPYGKGIIITGKIFDAENDEVLAFSTNDFGMGNITISNATSKQYTAKITFPDGNTKDIPLPKTEPLGVIIHVNTYRPDAVWFNVQTNEATRLLKKSYIVMLHANGTMYNNYRLSFSKGTALQFSIKKKELGRGILYATLFDENLMPIAERIFYNTDTIAKGKLSFKAEPFINDTVELKVNATDSLIKPLFTKLSISVLPEETILNHFDNSLWAESILRPTLKGSIENPNWYFEKKDIDHLIAIDNLLLTQGWRKYDWPTILKDTIHKFSYPLEEAFSVEGKVKNWLKNKPELKSKITFLSPLNKIFLFAPVDSLGEFHFDRVYLADSTWVIASASSDKGKRWNRVLQMSIPEFRLEAPDIKQAPTPPDKNIEVVGDIPKLTKGVIRLQEVVITGVKKNHFADNIYIGIMSRTLEITKENYLRYNNMELLLQIYFNVRTEHNQLGEYHFNMGRGLSSSGSSGMGHSTNEPLMMIDGMKVYSPQDILTFPINLVEAVAVNKDGTGAGLEGGNGVIAIKTRKAPLFDDNTERANIKRLMINGYAAPKKYFEPKYLIQPGTTDYDKYAAIYWKPDLIIDSTGIASFRFAVPKEIKSVTIRAEGISLEGIPFLHEQKLTLPGRD